MNGSLFELTYPPVIQKIYRRSDVDLSRAKVVKYSDDGLYATVEHRDSYPTNSFCTWTIFERNTMVWVYHLILLCSNCFPMHLRFIMHHIGALER